MILRLSRLLRIVFAASVAAALAPAWAAACPLGPAPVWAEYGGIGVYDTPVASVLARPGVTFGLGSDAKAAEYQSDGALTVGWHMHLQNIVGMPRSAAARSSVLARIPQLVSLARRMSPCDPPWLALNEIVGIQQPEPLTRSQLRYRGNVLALAKGLKARGVRVLLLLPRVPNANTRYKSYWRQLSYQATLVYEAYSFSSRRAISLGEVRGTRYLRETWTETIRRLRPFVVRPGRMGIMIPYWSKHHLSGRVGLSDPGWFRLTRMKVRAARAVANAQGLSTIWSWGWQTNANGERDADKPKAACVYLHERDPALCDPTAM